MSLSEVAMAKGARTVPGVQAYREALAEEMRLDPAIVVFGEGIGERGGCFGHTVGLWAEFGVARLVDTPIAELCFTGLGVGASMTGLRPVIDLMFAEFIMEAMSQVVNQAAKIRYASAGQFHCPLVVVAAIGRYHHSGPHHSGCYYPMFMHVPGLKVVVPSSNTKMKGLLKSAVRDNDPVVFCLPKGLLSKKMPVPQGEILIPLGRADICRSGSDITIVAIGQMVDSALEAADQLAVEGVEAEVIDPQTLSPMDVDTILKSVGKTGRLLLIDEAHETCNAAAEIAAQVVERGFGSLRAPIARLSTMRAHIPYAPPMEEYLFPSKARVLGLARQLVAG